MAEFSNRKDVFSSRFFQTCSLLFLLSVAFVGGRDLSAQDPSVYGTPNPLSGGSFGNPAQNDPTLNGNPSAGQMDGTQMPGVYGTEPNSIPRGANLQPNDDTDTSRRNIANREGYQRQALWNLPPDAPTEFQKMVLSSTGKFLPIYGAQLFRNAPSTFAPLDRVPVTPDYVIGPGDELVIQIWGQVTLNSHFTVDRTGEIYIPQVGSVRVAGLNFGQVREFLRSQISRVFRNFDLNVNMGQLRSIQVFVVGQARRPGSYTISSLSTLVDALFVTGGPSPQGSFRHIQLKRTGKVIADFDLYDLLERGDKTNDTQLLPGDVIYIPPIGAQVAVAGSINVPAIYELKTADTTTVDELLKLAAGPTNTASTQTVRLERVDAHKVRSVTDLALNEASLGQVLKDGDILELVSIVNRFSNGVILRGNVANPGQYAWKSGMRVSDLFPDKDALITRNYWLKRGQLGKPVLNYVPVCPPTQNRNGMTQGYGPIGTNGSYQSSGSYNQNNGSMNSTNIDPNSYDPTGQQQGAANSYQYPQDRQQDADGNREGENLGGCITVPQNLSTPADSQVGTPENQPPSSNPGYLAQMQSQQQRTMPVAGGSSAASAMVNRDTGPFQPRNDVKLSEPDIDWSYAVIERQDKTTLTTSLISFNLGKLVLENDREQDIALEPSDVVTIFSKADFRVPQTQQTRLVHLEGEFRSAGVYSVQPGETLKDLVKRAGGITEDAYLFGSEFTRESTRRVQQQRLNEYVDQIALQASTNSANNASRSVSALDTAAASAMASQSQSVIASLRQMRSSGRIVLELKPNSTNLDELPPISLEDGDRFVVPHIPATVSVAGAVYNPNSFVYNGQRRLKDYLQLAGGSNRDADRKSTYVIRADGSVVSRRQASSWRKDSFDTLRIYPGDTVVIPLNLSKGASLRTVVDIAQIVGQFGIAIAAANLVF